MIDLSKLDIKGHVTIKDVETDEVLVSKYNQIHYENLTIAIAYALSASPDGHIFEMHFGNGGSVVSGTGAITYFPPNSTGIDADLYNPTYYKVIDDSSPLNTNPARNSVNAKHQIGDLFSDVLIRCILEYNEPLGQQVFNDAVNQEGDFIFDEIGLKVFGSTPGTGYLISHVIFNPIQKSLNRQLEIIYQIRIQMC